MTFILTAPTAPPAAMEKTRISTAGNRGFTLLELIIVLFIAGMALTVVVFSAGRIREKAVFSDEVRRLCQTLKHAREIAIMERTDISVKLDAANNEYWIDFGGGKTSDAHFLQAGLVVSGSDVVFSPNGGSSGDVIKIQDAKGHAYEIDVDPVLGTPKIKRL
jgi:general secretion pathway protein H